MIRKTIEELGISVIGGQIINRVIANKDYGETVAESRKTIFGKSVKPGYIDENECVLQDYKTNCDEKRLTKKGDVVIKITAPFAAAYIDEEREGYLVSSFCSIMRINSDILNPKYLAAYLNGKEAKDYITKMMGGSTIATINMKNLKSLSVLIPPMNKQIEVAKALEQKNKVMVLTEKLNKLEEERVETIISSLEDK